MPDPSTEDTPAVTAHVHDARALRVFLGANQGDPIGALGEVEFGDIYRLDADAHPLKLRLERGGAAPQAVAAGSEVGSPGAPVALLASLTLIAPDGDRVEVLVLSLPGGLRLALPLSPMAPRTDYVLIDGRPDPGDLRVAHVVCASFAAGTRITLPGGALRPIETLAEGEAILTRDNGPVALRAVIRATLRGIGAFAPVVFRAGAIGNLGDLAVSPHHRMLIYQRGQPRLGGAAEILVQARHLVDGETVVRREGGFVDYLSLVFDRHEMIYAEGVAAESLMVTGTTRAVLPEPLAAELRARFPGLAHSPHFGTEIGAATMDAAARELLLGRRRDR